MKKCTCMGEESFVCRCLWEATLKELADWGYRAEKAEKELALVKAENEALKLPICDFGEGKDRTFKFKCLDFKKYDKEE